LPHGFDRKSRVADNLKYELAKCLLNNSYDPRFSFVSISSIEISKDYAHAKVYVTILDDAHIEEILAALNKASGFFRHELARTVNLRSTPRLSFVYDDTIVRGQKISELLSRSHKDQEK
jgi:ribosome-binding factor A